MDRPRIITGIAIIIAVFAIGVFAGDRNHPAQWQHDHPTMHGTAARPSTNQQKAPQNAAVATEALDGATAPADSLKGLGSSFASYVSVHDLGSSIYIEDLTRHVAVNVGETKDYNMMSLMKVPLVMTLYKASDKQLLSLDDKVTITPSEIDREFGDLWKKKAGYELSLHDAARLALQQSDNTAIHVINDHVFKVMPRQDRAYMAIPLDMQVDKNGDTWLSAVSFATIFRCLYDACYNSRHDSDEILDLLKHTDFNAPSASLPAGTAVAHKIGSASDQGFNDCGIVYGPKTPFIFCMMLDRTEPQADQDIAALTKLAYDYLEK